MMAYCIRVHGCVTYSISLAVLPRAVFTLSLAMQPMLQSSMERRCALFRKLTDMALQRSLVVKVFTYPACRHDLNNDYSDKNSSGHCLYSSPAMREAGECECRY